MPRLPPLQLRVLAALLASVCLVVASCSGDDDADSAPDDTGSIVAGSTDTGSTDTGDASTTSVASTTDPPPETDDVGTPTGQTGDDPCGASASLLAVDAVTGAPVWHRCSTSREGIEALGIRDGVVLAADYYVDGVSLVVLGLEAATGVELWSYPIQPFNESYDRDAFYADGDPTGGGVVVFDDLVPGAADHVMVGLDLATGAELWRVPAEGTFPTAHSEELAIIAEPTPLSDGPGDGSELRVVAVDRQTGQPVWTRAEGIGDMSAPWGPAIGAEVLVVPQVEPGQEGVGPEDLERSVVGLDLATGQERWRTQGGLFALAIADGTGFGIRAGASPDAAVLAAFALDSGEERWTYDVPPPSQGGQPWAVDVASPVVAVGDGTTVTALDAGTGQPRWSVDAPGRPVAVTDALVLVESGDDIVALDLADGTVRWTVPFAPDLVGGTRRATSDGDLVLLSVASGLS
jgi:outer membrane protein assembly factor BamB